MLLEAFFIFFSITHQCWAFGKHKVKQTANKSLSMNFSRTWKSWGKKGYWFSSTFLTKDCLLLNLCLCYVSHKNSATNQTETEVLAPHKYFWEWKVEEFSVSWEGWSFLADWEMCAFKLPLGLYGYQLQPQAVRVHLCCYYGRTCWWFIKSS